MSWQAARHINYIHTLNIMYILYVCIQLYTYLAGRPQCQKPARQQLCPVVQVKPSVFGRQVWRALLWRGPPHCQRMQCRWSVVRLSSTFWDTQQWMMCVCLLVGVPAEKQKEPDTLRFFHTLVWDHPPHIQVVATSVAVLAEKLLRSPKKLFIFILKKIYICRIKVSENKLI